MDALWAADVVRWGGGWGGQVWGRGCAPGQVLGESVDVDSRRAADVVSKGRRKGRREGEEGGGGARTDQLVEEYSYEHECTLPQSPPS